MSAEIIPDQSPSEASLGKQRVLGPLVIVLYFALIVSSGPFTAYALERLGLSRFEPLIVEGSIYAVFVVLPLSYALSRQVFTAEFWRVPKSTWKWVFIVAAVQGVVLLIPPAQRRLIAARAIAMVFIAPPLEEVARAVMLTPLVKRWGPFWAIVFTSVVIALGHFSPEWVIASQLALSTMFVCTDKSIPGTAIAHSIINTMTVLAGGIKPS